MSTKRIAVIGGGIVGVSTALVLQRQGYQVTLLDRRRPGRETSYGNAGVLSESSILVLNNPNLPPSLPKLLLQLTQGFRYSPFFLAKNFRWGLNFLSYCNERHMLKAAKALRELEVFSLQQHKAWIKEAQVDHLLADKGWLKVFRTEKSFQGYQSDLTLFQKMGVTYTVYDREALQALEPGLEPIYCKAVLLDETCRVTNPAALTDAYVRLFEAAGGTVSLAEVTGLHSAGQTWRITSNENVPLETDDVVLAAGPWSADIARWLGYDIPMAWERGFHLHLEPGAAPAARARHPRIDGGFVMAPMDQGVRITTGVELADRDAPANQRQMDAAVALARSAYPLKDPVESTPWVGRRPTLADSLPIIGPAPKHPGLWFNFGHQHVGLSTAPGSADIISALISERKPTLDAEPYRAQRFN